MSSDISVKTYTASCDYPITTPSGRIVEPPAGRCWRLSQNAFWERLQDNRIWFGPDGNGVPAIKRFLTELKFDGMAPTSILFYKDVGHSQEGAKEVTQLMEGGYFNGPKPIRLLRRLVTLANAKTDDIVLDFFSGSATTAHAVMQLNAEDGGHRKFIMVQLPEATDEKSEARKAGYPNICEIGKERIRRAGQKIVEEQAHLLNATRSGALQRGEAYAEFTTSDIAKKAQVEIKKRLDIGFRCLRLDSSNMQDVYYNPSVMTQDLLSITTDNIKPDRTSEDLLFQVMLDLGIDLSSPITETELTGHKVFDVADGFLLACFDAGVTTESVTAIAKRQPYYAVFRDNSMADDSTATNFDQIFETYSPSTVRKVL